MSPNKEQESLAAFFTALGHKRRLMICKILLQHDHPGMSFEMLEHHSKLATSTLSHHLSQMQKGKIIRRRRKGRNVYLSVDLSRFNRLPVEYLPLKLPSRRAHSNISS